MRERIRKWVGLDALAKTLRVYMEQHGPYVARANSLQQQIDGLAGSIDNVTKRLRETIDRNKLESYSLYQAALKALPPTASIAPTDRDLRVIIDSLNKQIVLLQESRDRLAKDCANAEVEAAADERARVLRILHGYHAPYFRPVHREELIKAILQVK